MEPAPLSGPPQQVDPRPAVPQMSLPGRMFNVLATPGDVFASIKDAKPNIRNWLAPAFLLMLVGWAASFLIFSQDSIRHQLDEMTSRAIEKQIEKSHMPKEQAEQVRAMGEKWGSIGTKISAYAAPPAVAIGMPLVWGLVLWLAGTKALKGDFPFLKAVEVAGLSLMVAVLDTVLRTLLILVTGNLFAAPGLVLLVKEYDPQNITHSLLAVVNVMTFWILLIRSMGLARIAGSSFAKAAAWVFGVWIAYTSLMLGFGFAMQRIFSR